jgi:hypothetical protein
MCTDFDRTGYGQHGDYIFGWTGNSLQRAMDARCGGPMGGECRQLTRQVATAASQCKLKQRVPEDLNRCKLKLKRQS